MSQRVPLTEEKAFQLWRFADCCIEEVI